LLAWFWRESQATAAPFQDSSAGSARGNAAVADVGNLARKLIADGLRKRASVLRNLGQIAPQHGGALPLIKRDDVGIRTGG
jgi:hypothetical protein